MGENDSFTLTVLSKLKEDDNANECVKCDESLQEIEPPKTDDELERKHFQRIVNAFRSYKMVSVEGVRRSLLHLSSLPLRHQLLLKQYGLHLEAVREAIGHNHEVVEVILEDVAHLFHNADHTHDTVVCEVAAREDVGKVCSVFRQLFREWSAEGRAEREASFDPILRHIATLFPRTHCDPSRVRILVPGAGLGRLPYEIAKMGYSCQGNEFSLFMLFTSNFVLNKCQGVELYSVHPWAHQHQNNVLAEDQLQTILFPDVDPSDLARLAHPDLEFSMAAGSFLEIYKEPASWDCVSTCFFLDTARNVAEYVDVIWAILKPGGWWLNLGPLLFHHADAPDGDSVEPAYEHIRDILVQVGFHITKEDLSVPTPYAQSPRSMLRHEYRSVFFVAQKPLSPCSSSFFKPA